MADIRKINLTDQPDNSSFEIQIALYSDETRAEVLYVDEETHVSLTTLSLTNLDKNSVESTLEEIKSILDKKLLIIEERKQGVLQKIKELGGKSFDDSGFLLQDIDFSSNSFSYDNGKTFISSYEWADWQADDGTYSFYGFYHDKTIMIDISVVPPHQFIGWMRDKEEESKQTFETKEALEEWVEEQKK